MIRNTWNWLRKKLGLGSILLRLNDTMTVRECHTCGEPFEAEVVGYILTNCPKCSERYLKGEHHLREKIRNEKEQKKLL